MKTRNISKEEQQKTYEAQAPSKVYVSVQIFFHEDGKMEPCAIFWEDGKRYAIDRVLSRKQAAAMKAGGQGDCYRIRVLGKETNLFFERSTSLNDHHLGRWFVERK